MRRPTRQRCGERSRVVRKQAEVGVDIPSDGEYGKLGWTSYVAARLSGLEPRTHRPGIRSRSIRAPPGVMPSGSRSSTSLSVCRNLPVAAAEIG